MITHFYALRHAFERSTDPPPQNVLEGVRTLPPVGVLPSLWTVWLWIALLVYRQRQLWARTLVRRHMSGAIPPCRRYCQADQPIEMNLPDAPDWDVYLECHLGWGTLEHRVTSEIVRFSITERRTEPYLSVDYLDGQLWPISRWHPAGRLVELHPTFRSMIWHAIDDLAAVGYLIPISEDRRLWRDPDVQPDGHRLNHQIAERYSPHVLQFYERWQQAENRLWLAALIGDWLLAHELAQQTNDAGLIEFTGAQATECQRLRAEVCRLASISREWNSTHVRLCRPADQ